jgi:hypothetical protein
MTNPNIPHNNPDQQPTPEQLRALDPAAEVIDVARDLRNSAYSSGWNDGDVSILFNKVDNGNSGMHGAYELLEQLVPRLRAEGRSDLSDYEQQFVDHMKLKASYNELAGTVDFDTLDGDSEIQAIIDDLTSKLATASDDEKIKLNANIHTLKDYMSLDAGVDIDDIPLETKFMDAHLAAETATDAEKATLDDFANDYTESLTKSDWQTRQRIRAYKIIAEYHPKTPLDPANLDDDPQLNYVDPASIPDQEPDQEPAPTITLAEAVAGLPADVLADQLATMRKVIANEKSKTVKNSLRSFGRNYKIGRKIVSRFTGLTEQQVASTIDPEEELYNALVVESARRENATLLNNPNANPQSVALALANGFLKEQGELRKQTNEKMKDKWTVKVGKWMRQHKVLTVAGATILLPLTGVGTAVAGLSLGLGLVVGAKTDNRFRGLRDVSESLTAMDLFSGAARGNDVIKEMQKVAMRDLEKNVSREFLIKRLGAIVTIGGIATAGTVLLPSSAGPTGFDTWIHGNQASMRWAGLIGAIVDLSISRRDKDKKSQSH